MISWIATFFSLLGVTLNAKKMRISWLVWIVANVLWATVGYRSGNPALMLLQITYVGFGIYGWFQWKPKPQDKSKCCLVYVRETDWGTTANAFETPRCKIVPLTPGYDQCTRRDGHDGPCANHLLPETTFEQFLASASDEIKSWPKWKQEAAARIAAGWKNLE